MKEKRVQAVFIDKILSGDVKFDDPAIVIGSEVRFGEGSRKADLVVLTDKDLIACEIKTDFDTLNRLPEQLVSYTKAFDFIYLIVSKTYLQSVLSLTEKKVGIFVIEGSDIYQYRKARKNSATNKEGYLSFLTKSDMAPILKEKGISITDSAKTSKEEIKKIIAEKCSKKHLKTFTHSSLSSKLEKRYSLFMNERGDVTIEEDLIILSNAAGY